MVQRIGHAAELTTTVPGCLDVDCWKEESSGAVVATGRFESKEAWLDALGAVAAANVDYDFDDRESRPRDVYNRIEPS